MSPMASQITGIWTVCWTVFFFKHTSKRLPNIYPLSVDFPNKEPVTRKLFRFDEVIIILRTQTLQGVLYNRNHWCYKLTCIGKIPVYYIVIRHWLGLIGAYIDLRMLGCYLYILHNFHKHTLIPVKKGWKQIIAKVILALPSAKVLLYDQWARNWGTSDESYHHILCQNNLSLYRANICQIREMIFQHINSCNVESNGWTQ